jgi:predicted lipoprotein
VIRRAALATLVIGALALAACSSGGSDGGSTTTQKPVPADTDQVLQDLADDVIVPSYEQLSTDLAALSTATDTLCATPSAANLEAAQGAWRDAVTGWQTTRAFGVGPALDDRLMSDVGFAARATVIEDLLESGDPVDQGALADEGAAARGIYAAEIALFGEGSETLAAAEGARRCEYTASVAALASEAADAVTVQWTDGDAAEAFVAGLDGGPQSSVALMVNELSHRLEELEMMGLRDMAEADSADDLDATRAGGPAGYRLADRAALLAGISAAVGDGTSGVSALVGAKDADTMQRLVAAQAEADEAVAALPDSVDGAFDDPGAIAAASEAVSALKVLVSTEAASKLGVTITFSDSDGDS